jgi:hypothetical protein
MLRTRNNFQGTRTTEERTRGTKKERRGGCSQQLLTEQRMKVEKEKKERVFGEKEKRTRKKRLGKI